MLKRHLLLKLQHMRITGLLLQGIDAFLSKRRFKVEVALSNWMQILSGVAQGSVFGPLLFIVYTADLKKIIQSPFAMYADDVKLYNVSSNSNILTQGLLAVSELRSY